MLRKVPVQFDNDPNESVLDDSWREGLTREQFNAVYDRILEDCNAGRPSCPPNGKKLILLGWHHFTLTFEGLVQGEDIWCGSMMDAIRKLGYSMIVPRAHEITEYYRRYHKNVHLIIAEHPNLEGCMYNSTCTYADFGDLNLGSTSPAPPPNATHLNIPIWKLFYPHWWNEAAPPLGGPFTLSPEPYDIWPTQQNAGKDNFYLGYSVESSCTKTPFIPPTQRPRQTYILGKSLRYFTLPEYTLWTGDALTSIDDPFYLDFSQDQNVTFLAGQLSHHDNDDVLRGKLRDPPRGIVQHEKLSRSNFQKALANSRVMLGLGNPRLSPTPYEALCLGVPFINPLMRGSNKNDRTTWTGQHDALIFSGLDEPYVYHVEQGDRAGLAAALRKAMDTPIERYIPPRMTSAALLGRMKSLLETDWRSIAKERMKGYKYHH
ncbi:hypothetical protein FRB90_011338 [Tulasnella sp. 427]|nr:hypothetical protein FRB90_011338 [Tulasnella sp. 427]